jgi:succinate dehydrogenase / fumarate reductase, cytochrome b subunit
METNRPMAEIAGNTTTFFGRHEFLIRRLHSLSGLVPVGAYMVVHLLTNASLLNGVPTFQNAVNQIHSLGVVLPVVEWAFIFLPILFHGIFGVWIIQSGHSNLARYRYTSNFRYAAQRWTGVIAFVFILVHVLHLHGWFHFEAWLHAIQPWGLGAFKPYNATSTLAAALQGYVWPVFYVVGVLACVYHLANGLWTFGITWGIWVSPAAQKRATLACTAFGVMLGIVGLSALGGAKMIKPEEARAIEDKMNRARIESGEIAPNDEKLAK